MNALNQNHLNAQFNRKKYQYEDNIINDNISNKNKSPLTLQQSQQSQLPKFMYGQTFISRLLATWVTPILNLGYQKLFNEKFIPDFQKSQRSKHLLEDFERTFKAESQSHKDLSPGWLLMLVVLKYNLKSQITFLLVMIISIVCQSYLIIFSSQLIQYIEQNFRTTTQNFKYLIVYSLLSFGRTIIMHYSYYLYRCKDCNTASIVTLMLFKKILKYPIIASKQFQISQIINYSQSDAKKFEFLHWTFAIALLNILQVTFFFSLLFSYLGVGMIGCIILLVVFLLLSYVTLVKYEFLEQKFYEGRDKTLKIIEQILSSIKFIKFNALEKYFLEKVQLARSQQLRKFTKSNITRLIITFLYYFMTPCIVLVSLLIYKQLQGNITTWNVFFILMIFNTIQVNLKQLPESIRSFIDIMISSGRICKFLMTQQIHENSAIKYQTANHNLVNAIQIRNGNFLLEKQYHEQQQQGNISLNYQSNQQQNQQDDDNIFQLQQGDQYLNEREYLKVLNDVNITFKRGVLTMITGEVGSGKTSLFYSIINQTIKQQGSNSLIKINGSVAYCPQKSWLFNGTIKQNITFFQQFNQKRFNDVLHCVKLDQDVKLFRKGVLTQIGERGVNLSGGQKLRISLARALYSDKDIYLLDDILSSLDVNVAQFILQNAIRKYLKGKTVVITTHHKKFLQLADEVYCVEQGKIQKNQQYKKKIVTIDNKFKNRPRVNFYYINKQRTPIQPGAHQMLPVNNVQKHFLNNKQQVNKQHNHLKTDDNHQEIILAEQKPTGDIPCSLYSLLLKLNGGNIFSMSILIILTWWSFSSFTANYQISKWSQDNQKNVLFLYLYFGFAIKSAFLVIIAQIILLTAEYFKNKQTMKIIMHSLVHARLTQFFNRIPMGRIINRISNDLLELDIIATTKGQALLISLFSIISSLIACIYAASFLALIPIIILAVIFYLYFSFFIKTHQQCLRYERSSNSPILSGITQLINGIDSIRAYNKSEKVIQNMFKDMDRFRRFQQARLSMQYWFIIRYSFYSVLIIICFIAYCLFNRSTNGSEIGIILLYSMAITQQIGYIYCYVLYFRDAMVSVERVAELFVIQEESGYSKVAHSEQKQNDICLANNIRRGKYSIQFINYSARYRQGLPFVLRDLNIKIQKNSKVGVVGRTGAGKSTLINAILRIIEPAEGKLYIDGRQIRQSNISELRNSITIIEQDPIIMNSTLRNNIDPIKSYKDDEIIKILCQCKLQNFLNKDKGLNSTISNRSTSAGQRQLICICRALLKKSSIVLIDEATSNIDIQRDQIIQQIIQRQFKNSTVLTIAHRLSTIKKYQKILVLQQGKVVEWGNSQMLLKSRNSIYYKMCQMNDQEYLSN